MTTVPKVRQTRRSITLANGSVRYEVVNEITDKGDLPFPHLFVLKVGDGADPKDDLFARIATPVDIRQSDETAPIFVKVAATDLVRISPDVFVKIPSYNELTRLLRDRVEAQRNGQTYYLSTVAAFMYDSLTTADAAAKQVIDRLSTLVNDWRKFNVDFATNPYEELPLPQTGSSVESARVAVFKDKRAARLEAEATRDADALAKEACVRDCEADKTLHAWLVTQTVALEQADAVVSALSEVSSAKDFVLQQNAYSTDSRSFRTILTQTRALRDQYAATVQACAIRCTQLGAKLLASQQAADAAMQAENAALADVIAVCPTFNPDSV